MTQDGIEDLLPVHCQICREHIANVRMLRLPGGQLSFPDLQYPLTGAMFLSPDAGHGIVPPFHESHGWELFRCPHGGHRPIVLQTKVQTAIGTLNIEPGREPFIGGIMGESDREQIIDRPLDGPRMMTEEEAAAEYRRRISSEEKGINGAEGAENEKKEDDKEIDDGADGEREAETGGEGDAQAEFICDRCPGVFRSRSGLMRHRKAVHGLRTAWGR